VKKPVIISGTMRNERGTVLVMTVFMVILFMILTMGLVEFGRMMIYREKLQTAADAASLAGATTEVHRWVQLKVTTDRGQRTHCYSCGNGDTCCKCVNCGTVSRTTPWMEEKDLIENGDWTNFCYPPCDCGGGDCRFKVLARKVTYDITSRYTPVTLQDVKNFRDEMTEAVRESLVAVVEREEIRGNIRCDNRSCSRAMRSFLKGKSLEQISYYLGNKNAFLYAYPWYHCRPGVWTCAWETDGYGPFRVASAKKEWVDRVIAQVNSFNKLTSAYGNIAERKVEDYVDYYFYANVPDNAQEAAVVVHDKPGDPYYPSVTVYGRGYVLPVLAEMVERITGNTGIAKTGSGFKPVKVDVCSQGATYYRDPRSQSGNHTGSLKGIGTFIQKPGDACWRDYNMQ